MHVVNVGINKVYVFISFWFNRLYKHVLKVVL